MRGGHKEIALILIEAGTSVTHIAHEGSYSSAYCAAFADSEQVFERLLVGGASLTLQTFNGFTPLHSASWSGRMNSIRFLLKNM